MRQSRRSEGKSGSQRWLLLFCCLFPCLTEAQYTSQAFGYNQQQQQAALFGSQDYGYYGQQQQQQPQLSYDNRPYSAAREETEGIARDAHSIWSGAPIVVNDLPTNLYYNNNKNYGQRTPPTQAASNYNYNSGVGGYFYPDSQQKSLLELNSELEREQRELLAAAEARRQEDAVVRIGGGRRQQQQQPGNNNNNNNYYEPPQQLRRDLAHKYASHYANYLSKYPQRLQPFYNTGADIFDGK